MAVTDIGALIAESIDTFYFNIGLQERIERRCAERKAYFEWLKAKHHQLQEAGGRFMDQYQGGEEDPRKHNDADYRKGYKTGWKAAKDGHPQNPQPQPKNPVGNLQNYQNGYAAGYETRTAGGQLVDHYDRGKRHAEAGNAEEAEQAFDQADALTVQHFSGPSFGRHYPMGGDLNAEAVWQRWVGAEQDPDRNKRVGEGGRFGQYFGHGSAMSHARNAIALADEHIDLPDEDGLAHRENSMLGKKKLAAQGIQIPEDSHHVNHRPHPADIADFMIGKYKAKLASLQRGGGIEGGRRAREREKGFGDIGGGGGFGDGDMDDYFLGGGGADEGPAKKGQRGRERAEVGSGPGDFGPGGYLDDPVLVDDPEDSEASASGSEAGGAPETPSQPEGDIVPTGDPELMKQVQGLHNEYVGQLGLLRSALGDDVVDAHLAHGRGEEGGAHHAGIQEFVDAGYQPHQYDDYVKHAHEVWKGHILDKAREAQAAGNPLLKKRSVPMFDPNNREPEFTFTHPKTGKEVVGGGHWRPLLDEAGNHVHQELDPVQYLENSLNDPYGHKGDAPEYEVDPETGEKTHLGKGWNQRHAKQMGFDLPKARRVKSPADKGRGSALAPSVARIQRGLDGANQWLHSQHEGHHENEMWDYHYGLAEKAGYTRKREDKEEVAKRRAARDVEKRVAVSHRPKQFLKGKLDKGASELAAKLKAGREARRERLKQFAPKQVEDFAYFMLGLLDEWLEENTMASKEKRGLIMDSLWGRIEANYGNLFEVCA